MIISKYLAPTLIICAFVFTHTKTVAQKTTTINSKASISKYEKYIDDNNDKHLKEFLELVSIPSISSIPANKPDVVRTAAWLVNKLNSIGISSSKQLATDGNPVVYASWDKAPGKPTVLIYGHYDVQPVKESEWDHPPFAPVIKDGKIYGRGASDDKSGVITAICAIEAMLRTDGKLPVNVKFLFEGEEEIGSPNFKKFLENNKALLKTDFAVTADDIQGSETDPAITLSLRGAAQLEFSVKTANTDAHSGQFGGKTPNAVLAMAQIISSLYDKVGNVAVEGFYDKVLPITAAQKEMMKRIPYDAATDMKILGTTAEVGDPAYTAQERMWFRPTLEIIGMQGGYTATEGHSNIIPGHAMARITCRLVNNQIGQEIIDLIVKHINKNCPVGATVSFKYKAGYASPMQYPTDTKGFQYVSDALTAVYDKQPLLMAAGGSGGAMLSFKETLGVYAYSLGFELPDEKWHASNEFFRVSSFRKGQQVYCYFLQHLAEEESKLKK
jgi:acetylornithine deacetylase/succinyl-diaminopimelate desuccinylase-like protein